MFDGGDGLRLGPAVPTSASEFGKSRVGGMVGIQILRSQVCQGAADCKAPRAFGFRGSVGNSRFDARRKASEILGFPGHDGGDSGLGERKNRRVNERIIYKLAVIQCGEIIPQSPVFDRPTLMPTARKTSLAGPSLNVKNVKFSSRGGFNHTQDPYIHHNPRSHFPS